MFFTHGDEDIATLHNQKVLELLIAAFHEEKLNCNISDVRRCNTI
jgi:hypothetical protein